MSISCRLQVGTLTPLPPSLIHSHAPPPHPTLPTAASPQFMRSILITSISALSAGVEHLCYCTLSISLVLGFYSFFDLSYFHQGSCNSVIHCQQVSILHANEIRVATQKSQSASDVMTP